MMPLAGRLADLWGARRLFLGALVVFTVGSVLAGAAQNLDQLIAARLVQAVGGGVLVPVGTAAAAHLFDGHGAARALGVIGALTFLGMAAGPFLGRRDPVGGPPGGRARRPPVSATSTRGRGPRARPGAGSSTSTSRSASSPWSWPGPRPPAGRRRAAPAGSTSPGRVLFGVALATGLIALTLLGADGRSPAPTSTRRG